MHLMTKHESDDMGEGEQRNGVDTTQGIITP
jgi:hypothetical protein